jgi:predicted O-methyltransferase YrrM
VVVADNIVSHGLAEYVAHVRARSGVESVTLPVGKGLEVTRFV